jgi:hypothetical protein
MNLEELFVGVVAVVLGLVGIVAAIGNWDHWYRFSKIRWIESIGGRRCARALYALLGIVLIALGVAIALGFGPNKSEPQSGRRFSSPFARLSGTFHQPWR